MVGSKYCLWANRDIVSCPPIWFVLIIDGFVRLRCANHDRFTRTTVISRFVLISSILSASTANVQNPQIVRLKSFWGQKPWRAISSHKYSPVINMMAFEKLSSSIKTQCFFLAFGYNRRYLSRSMAGCFIPIRLETFGPTPSRVSIAGHDDDALPCSS